VIEPYLGRLGRSVDAQMVGKFKELAEWLV
jgi:hypothetical protein